MKDFKKQLTKEFNKKFELEMEEKTHYKEQYHKVVKENHDYVIINYFLLTGTIIMIMLIFILGTKH